MARRAWAPPRWRRRAAAAAAINPLVRVLAHEGAGYRGERRSADRGLDIVCDGTDNFAARYLLADACHQAGKVLVSASVLRFEGQLAVFAPGYPCYRCLYPEAPPAGLVPSCAEAGVLGAVTGVMGTLQATEVLKCILGIGETLAGRLLLWDALTMRFRIVKLAHDPGCALCGPGAEGRDAAEYAAAGAGPCSLRRSACC